MAQRPNGRCTPDGKSPTPCAFHSNCQGYCLFPAWIAWILWRKMGRGQWMLMPISLSVLAEAEAAVSSIPTPRHAHVLKVSTTSLQPPDFLNKSWLCYKLILPETNQTPISSLPTLFVPRNVCDLLLTHDNECTLRSCASLSLLSSPSTPCITLSYWRFDNTWIFITDDSIHQLLQYLLGIFIRSVIWSAAST